MAFFLFGRKFDVAKDYSLEEIPLFSALTVSEQRLIEKKARLVEFKRGDIVYQEGTAPDAFYVIISGRFRLYNRSRGSSNKEETIVYLHRGDHFGETSLLTGQKHSVTVEAKRDGVILKLSKEDFLNVVRDIPALSLHLSRSLGHRLTKNADASSRREVKVCSLYAEPASPEVISFWMDMAASLQHETSLRVVLVDFSSTPAPLLREAFKRDPLPVFDFKEHEPSRDADLQQAVLEHPMGFHYVHAPTDRGDLEGDDDRKISTLLTFLTYRYNYLLLRLPRGIESLAFKVLKQSDYVYVYCAPQAAHLEACAEAVMEFQQSFGFSKSEIRILMPEEKEKSPLSHITKEEILGCRIFSVLADPKTQQERYAAGLRYLTRELAGNLTGLVLGSGAAFGLAHIGVLRVLEQEGIPIDIISGSSIGALVGALWAASYSANDLEKLAYGIDRKSGFFKLLGFRDISIAHRGFFKGNQVTRFLKSYLGDRTFQDLKIPVKIAAVDLFTSEELVLDSGKVVDAIRASISIPGIFRPVPYQGRHLIDGGVIDPLPVRILGQLGVKKIIAVNVLSGPKDRIERTRVRNEHRRQFVESVREKPFLGRLFARGLNQVYNRYAVNIFNVIMSTIQFMEYEIAESWGEQADVLIHPIVPEGHWAEFYSPAKYIQIGEARTREQIADIKRLVAE